MFETEKESATTTPQGPLSRIVALIKSVQAILAAFALILGGAVLVRYWIDIGFVPSIKLEEFPFLLGAAALVGSVLLLALIMMFFAPALLSLVFDDPRYVSQTEAAATGSGAAVSAKNKQSLTAGSEAPSNPVNGEAVPPASPIAGASPSKSLTSSGTRPRRRLTTDHKFLLWFPLLILLEAIILMWVGSNCDPNQPCTQIYPIIGCAKQHLCWMIGLSVFTVIVLVIWLFKRQSPDKPSIRPAEQASNALGSRRPPFFEVLMLAVAVALMYSAPILVVLGAANAQHVRLGNSSEDMNYGEVFLIAIGANMMLTMLIGQPKIQLILAGTLAAFFVLVAAPQVGLDSAISWAVAKRLGIGNVHNARLIVTREAYEILPRSLKEKIDTDPENDCPCSKKLVIHSNVLNNLGPIKLVEVSADREWDAVPDIVPGGHCQNLTLDSAPSAAAAWCITLKEEVVSQLAILEEKKPSEPGDKEPPKAQCKAAPQQEQSPVPKNPPKQERSVLTGAGSHCQCADERV